MHPPLLLTYAASYVRSKGHKVELVDAQAEAISVKSFIEKTKRLNPDFLVCETSTPSFTNDADIVNLLKKEIPGLRTVFLGPHVSALPEESLKTSNIDCVVMGEYEESLLEYIENGPKRTKGIAYKSNGQVVINDPRGYIENLDNLPFPARDLLPNYKYFDPILKNPFTFILGGRGCPYRCTFCNWPQTIAGRKYRVRSPQNIVDELQEILEKYNFRSILFNDDTFTANREHATGVCEEILKRGLKFPWACYARADTTDIGMLSMLRKSGCYLLKIGVESGNQEILDRVRKGYKIERVKEAVRLMLDMGFHVHATFVIGLPGETERTTQDTINFAVELNPTTVQFSCAIPYPGTEFYEHLQRNKNIIANCWEEFMPLRPIFEYPSFPADEITNSIKRAYRQYYLRPKYVKIAVQQLLTQPGVLIGNVRKLIQFIW